MSAGHLRDLRARRELELVADDAGPGDRADDRRLDAEVGERLHEHERRPLAHVRGVAAGRRARLQERAIGKAVLRSSGRGVEVERRVLPGRRLLGIGSKQRRWPGRQRAVRDDVGERLEAVHRRRLAHRRLERGSVRVRLRVRPVGPLDALDRTARGRAGLADRVTRAPQERSCRRARDEQHAGEDERCPDDQRAGPADDAREATAQRAAESAAVLLAERDHEPDEADGEPGAERPEVDERAADEHQPTDPEQRRGNERRGGAERSRRASRTPASRPGRRPSRARAPSRGSARPRRGRAPRARDDGVRGSSSCACGRVRASAASWSAPARPASSSWPWACCFCACGASPAGCADVRRDVGSARVPGAQWPRPRRAGTWACPRPLRSDVSRPAPALPRRSPRPRPCCRTRGSRPSPPRGPCRPGRSARSRSEARAGCRARRGPASTPGP